MTKIDEHNDHDNQDKNLGQLIGLGDPLPRMPENLKARIRTRLAEVGQVSEKKSFLLCRWVIVSPLAAATVLALLLIFFWPGGTPGTISWADVQRKLEQVRTMTARFYWTSKTLNGKWRDEYLKIYIKNPGLSRIDYCDTAADSATLKSGTIPLVVRKDVSSLHEQLRLDHYSHKAYWITRTGRTLEMPPVTLLPLDSTLKDNNYASGLWDQLKQITSATKTKHIGKRTINGKPAVGFGFEVPVFQPIYKESTYGKIWVGRDDGVPLFIELEYKDYKGQKVQRLEWSDIQWDVPLEEGLFDFNVPVGWSLERNRNNESIEYTGFGLKPGVTLEIGPEGQRPLATTVEVIGVVKAQRNTASSSYPFIAELITIEFTTEASKRIQDYANTHPAKVIVVNFNGKIKTTAILDAAHPTQVSFDISSIHITENMLVQKYIAPHVK